MMHDFNKLSRESMDMDQVTNCLTGWLANAYRSKSVDTEPADSRFRQNVMRSVRQIGPINAKNNSTEFFGYLTWRLAPVAALLLIFMTLWIARIDNTLEFQIASLVVSDPMQTDIYRPF